MSETDPGSGRADGLGALRDVKPRRRGWNASRGRGLVLKLFQGRTPRNAIGTFALKVTATAVSLGTSIVLARMLGADGFGVYRYALAWTTLVTVVAVLGLDKLVVREVAASVAHGAWGRIHGLIRRATQWTLGASVLLAGLVGGAGWVIGGRGDVALTLLVALLLVPITALTRVRQAVMQGLRFAARGHLPEMLVGPGVFLALAVGVWRLAPSLASAPLAAALNVAAAAAAFIVGTILLIRVLPAEVRAHPPEYDDRAWLRSVPPLVLVSGMFVINSQVDQIMLGILLQPADVGVYAVARRGADLIAFVLVAVNAALGPSFARLYAQGDRAGMQRTATVSARAILVASLPIAIGMIVFGRIFLSIFGPEFVRGYSALVVLSAGQLFNAAIGSVGLMLVMTGHERDVARNIGVSVVVNIFLNLLLVPRLGVLGAACATAASVMVVNTMQALSVRKRLQISPSAFGGWR